MFGSANKLRAQVVATIMSGVVMLLFLNASALPQDPSARKGGPVSAIPTPLEDNEGCVLPFRYEPPIRPFITIQMQIDNSDPLTVEVDTGSPYTLILAPWAQRKLGLLPTGKTVSLGPNSPNANLAKGGRLKFLPLIGSRTMEIDLPEVMVADMSLFPNYMGPRVAGVVGGDFFKLNISRFDFDRKTLTFFPPDRSPIKPTKDGIVLPLALRHEAFRGTVTLPLAPQLNIEYVVDTGSDSVVLPTEAVQKVARIALGVPGRVFNVTGEHTMRNVLLPRLNVGSMLVPLVPVIAQAGAAEPLLGLSLLSRFRMTIDPTHQQLILEPGKPTPITWSGDAGIRLTSRDNRMYISEITRAEALQAGMQINDEVVSIDGQNLSDLPYNQRHNLLDGEADTWMSLTVLKPDKTQRTARLLRRSQYKNILRNELGLIVAREKNDTWQILWVQPESQADKAGLQVDDQLTLINGQSVVDLVGARVEEFLAAAENGVSPLKTLSFKQQKTGAQVTLTRQ